MQIYDYTIKADYSYGSKTWVINDKKGNIYRFQANLVFDDLPAKINSIMQCLSWDKVYLFDNHLLKDTV